jgi:hypothetical protein
MEIEREFFFPPVLHSSVSRDTDGVFSGKSTVTKPDNLLQYITIHYFVFLVFLIFCTIRRQNAGKVYVVYTKVREGEVYEKNEHGGMCAIAQSCRIE